MNEMVDGARSTRAPHSGFTLVEVLVGLAVLAIVSGALVALQVGSLRAARMATDTRAMAAVAQHQLGLARLLPELSGCRDLEQWPAVDSCEVKSTCLVDGCTQRVIEVQVVSAAGRRANWQTVVDEALESAPVGAHVATGEGATATADEVADQSVGDAAQEASQEAAQEPTHEVEGP